jgi:uncharacterized membrane protein
VIKLNRALERAKRRRWLWILLVILLAVLLALVALHSFNDSVETDGALFCAAVILLVAAVIVRPVEPVGVVVPARAGRGPPRVPVASPRPLPVAATSFAPLRL